MTDDTVVTTAKTAVRTITEEEKGIIVIEIIEVIGLRSASFMESQDAGQPSTQRQRGSLTRIAGVDTLRTPAKDAHKLISKLFSLILKASTSETLMKNMTITRLGSRTTSRRPVRNHTNT